jgi:hypothetical protein
VVYVVPTQLASGQNLVLPPFDDLETDTQLLHIAASLRASARDWPRGRVYKGKLDVAIAGCL